MNLLARLLLFLSFLFSLYWLSPAELLPMTINSTIITKT